MRAGLQNKKMNLTELVQRPLSPEPWEEGENIPWYEPGFSQRMLREHLSQEHDAASRRFTTIDRHVSWIQQRLLSGRPGRILDLGCGPGLYSSRLARLGYTCLGIDYSPASIDYARAQASKEGLTCQYRLEDIRKADYGNDFDLVMLIYGEFNVFRPADAHLLLHKAHQALKPGGMLLLEPHPLLTLQRIGQQPSTWYSSSSGLFSEKPHFCLKEHFWDGRSSTVTIRYFILDAGTGEVSRYAQSFQAYTDEQYHRLLEEHSFIGATFYPSLGELADASGDLIAITARKSL